MRKILASIFYRLKTQEAQRDIKKFSLMIMDIDTIIVTAIDVIYFQLEDLLLILIRAQLSYCKRDK